MRGTDEQKIDMFSYLSHEKRVPKDHPLPDIRTMVDQVLARLSRRFDGMYASVGGRRFHRRSCCGRNCCRFCTPSAGSVC
jgi:hypothetical protein